MPALRLSITAFKSCSAVSVQVILGEINAGASPVSIVALISLIRSCANAAAPALPAVPVTFCVLALLADFVQPAVLPIAILSTMSAKRVCTARAAVF